MKTGFLSIAAGIALSFFVVHAADASTLDDVKKKGFVQCGVNPSLLGFAATNDAGEYQGFDIDYCKAVAVAVFGDPGKVKYTPLNAKDRFTALQSGEIDVLTRNSTWTISREASLGLLFPGVNYYDGQGFMVRKSENITSALGLAGATVCLQTGTTTELNLADYFKAHQMAYTLVAFESNEEARAAYESGRCDTLTTDASGLYATRMTLSQPDDHIILPEIISKEPLGPVVRQGDDQWFNIVKWVHYALVTAEELGVTEANVDQMKTSGNDDVKRLLGAEDKFGESLGLGNDWAYGVIKTVGNYGEIFDRNLGAGSKLKIARGLNALWSKGGIQYAPPIR